MSTLQLKRGNKANLPTSGADGELILAKDIGELWYGTGAGRQEVSYVHLNKTETITGDKTFVGSVGIGKTPTYKLDVDGTIFASSTTNTITGGFGGKGGTGLVGLGNTSGTPTMQGYNAGFAGTANITLQPVGGNTGMGVVDPQATIHGGGSTILGCPSSQLSPAAMSPNQLHFYANEAANQLVFFYKKTDGTMKTCYMTMI